MDANDRAYQKLLKDSMREANRAGLDTSVKMEKVDSSKIVPFEREGESSEKNIKHLAQVIGHAIDEGYDWPSEMPIPIIAWNEEGDAYDVIDGNHRVIASKLVRLPEIPALIIDHDAYDALVEGKVGDGIDGLTWIDALALDSPVLRENLRLDRLPRQQRHEMGRASRKEINDYITNCLKKMGRAGRKIEVAYGGTASPSQIWQGDKLENGPWAGDLLPLTSARKHAQPGDWLDCYVYQRYGFQDWELETNIIIRIPDPDRGIQGECYEGAIR